MYLTAPGHFDRTRQPMGLIFYLSKTGEVTKLADNLIYPNGIAIYGGELYVSEHLAKRVIKFPLKAKGQLGKKKLFTNFKNDAPFRNKDPEYTGPDGIEISKNGTIYIAEYARGRIFVYEANGQYKKSLHTGLPYVTNMALDKSETNLVITGAKSLDSFLQLGEVYIQIIR